MNIKTKNALSSHPHYSSSKKTVSFTSKIDTAVKLADLFVKSQENLSSTRFIQDTATNWFPKAIFSRSKADFAEMSFLEFIESAIFYFASPILGQKIFRNGIFKNLLSKDIKSQVNEQIPKTVQEIVKNNDLSSLVKNKALATKAGIILACTIIPVAEYTLSFAKNLFTLKTFKKSNFNNIANLDKGKFEKEDIDQQKKVEKNAIKHLKRAGIISAAGIGAGIALSLADGKSEKLTRLSKAIIEPGKAFSSLVQKLGLKNEKFNNAISKFNLDFSNSAGKLSLGKGQLALTAVLGLFGYSKAASDRGKLDVLEVWTRVPLVVFYTIFGSELLEKSFVKHLDKSGKFKDLIKKDLNGNIYIPKREDLSSIASTLAKQKNTGVQSEFNNLIKQKAFVTGVPYAFSLLFMGFTLSAITRIWTQYRYNHAQGQKNKDVSCISNLSFQDFKSRNIK